MKYYIIRRENKYIAGTVFTTRKEAEESIKNNPNPIERQEATIEAITDIDLFNHLMRWIVDLIKE